MSGIKISDLTYLNSNQIKPEWTEVLSVCKLHITFATPMFGFLMMRCKFKYSLDFPYVAGAAVTATENLIVINPLMFFNDEVLKGANERAFVMLHEILHIFLAHGERCAEGGLDPMLWNQATDYNINLTANGTYRDENGNVAYNPNYQKYLSKPDWVLYDESFIGLSSNEIYDLLKQHGSAKCNGGEIVDEVIPSDISSENVQQQISKNTVSMKAAVDFAKQSKSVGVNEGDIVKYIEEMAKPKVSWNEYLSDMVVSSLKERPTYSKYSRRNGGSVVFPTYVGQKANIVFGIDTSGSMMYKEAYMRCAAELYGIIEQFEGWELELVTCDTRLHKLGKYSSEDGDEFSNIELTFTGGGGTELSPIAQYAQELIDDGEDVSINVIMTDGYIPIDVFDDALPTFGVKNVVVVVEGGNRDFAIKNGDVIFM